MVAAHGRSGTELPSLPEVDVVFDALAHEARRHIVQVLAHHGPELPSGYLAKRFTHSWPTTTRHLHVLEAAGVVSVRRDGRRCVYRLERDRLRRVIGGWLAQLDPPTSEQTWPPSGPRSVTKGTTLMSTAAKLFRVTLEVADLESAADLYRDLLDIEGKRHPGARHYFDCGGVILAVLDVSLGGMMPTPGPKSLYFAVDDLDAVHDRASRLGVLAPYQVHGEPAGEVLDRPWGERSFYVVDPWGNDLCFCQDGTLYT